MADPDAKGGADSSAFLEDMLHESGMAGWVQQLGLKGHEQFASCAMYNEEPDPVLNLHYGVGNADPESNQNAAVQSRAESLASRIRNRSPADEAGPERRRARHLAFGAESEQDELGTPRQEGDGDEVPETAAVEKEGGEGQGEGSSAYTTRSRGGAAGSEERKESVGGRGERVRAKREEASGDHKGLAVLTAAAKCRAEDEEGGEEHASPGHAHVPSTPSQTPGPRRDKGLRSFSLKVCQKVEERDVTTYNQVADELVSEFRLDESVAFDEKNVRRRIYDALNVLMAMDIITKDKKHIKWKGFPQSWEKEREGLERRVEEASRQVTTPPPPPLTRTHT